MTDEHFTLLAIALAMVVAGLICYRLARWFSRHQVLRAAERVARSLAADQSLALANPALRAKLERYRLARVRAALAESSALHEAARELVSEHRLSLLEHG